MPIIGDDIIARAPDHHRVLTPLAIGRASRQDDAADVAATPTSWAYRHEHLESKISAGCKPVDARYDSVTRTSTSAFNSLAHRPPWAHPDGRVVVGDVRSISAQARGLGSPNSASIVIDAVSVANARTAGSSIGASNASSCRAKTDARRGARQSSASLKNDEMRSPVAKRARLRLGRIFWIGAAAIHRRRSSLSAVVTGDFVQTADLVTLAASHGRRSIGLVLVDRGPARASEDCPAALPSALRCRWASGRSHSTAATTGGQARGRRSRPPGGLLEAPGCSAAPPLESLAAAGRSRVAARSASRHLDKPDSDVRMTVAALWILACSPRPDLPALLEHPRRATSVRVASTGSIGGTRGTVEGVRWGPGLGENLVFLDPSGRSAAPVVSLKPTACATSQQLNNGRT